MAYSSSVGSAAALASRQTPSSTPAGITSRSPLMQSISKGYGTLSKQEFWEILERMVLPRLELLDAWEKEEIQAAFEGRELADDDEADKPEEAEEDDEFVVKTWDDFAKAESRLQVVAQLGLSRIDAEHDFAEKDRMFVELQGYMTRQRIAGVTSYIKASRPGTKFGDTALYTILQLKSGAKGLPDLDPPHAEASAQLRKALLAEMLAPEGLLLNRAIQESQEEVMKGIVGNLEPGEGMILMDSVKDRIQSRNGLSASLLRAYPYSVLLTNGVEAFRTAPCLDDYKQLMAYDESTGAKLHQMLLDLVFPPRKPKLATHLTPTLVLVAEHDFLTHSDHDSMTSLIALLLGLPRAEFACAAADAARLTLSAALAFERSRHRLLNLTLKPELRSAIKAIHAARDIEFHRLSEVLDNLDDEEERLLSMQLPEVKLGEPGWKVKEALRRELEKKQEEALDSFAEALEGDEDERKSWALAGPEPQEGWAARFGVGEERKPKMEDRQLGNRLLLWLDVLRQWPDAEQVAQLGEDFWRSTGMWTGVLESKPVVELLVSLVRKSGKGYDPEATNLRDGLWVLMLASSREDRGVGQPRISPHY